MKITIENISKELDQVQDEYELLFDDLILLKNFKSKHFRPSIIYDFQYKLGLQLYNLSVLRKELVAAENKLIDKKSHLKEKWFLSRIRLYKIFKTSIDNCIDIGRTLGDAFAWHFYQFNLKDLFSHTEYEDMPLPPTGIGGLGEIEFIKRHFIMNNHFILLHGLTNFLKVGDVSMVSLEDFHLTAVGELKTKQEEDGTLTITLASVNAENRQFFKDINYEKVVARDLYQSYFDPGRFRRQMEKIKTIARPEKKENVLSAEEKLIFDTYYCKELEEVVDGLQKKIIAMYKPNPRLLLAANRLPGKTFSARLFEKEDKKAMDVQTAEIEKEVISLYDLENPNHAIQFGSIHYDKNRKPIFLIGASPLFWYRIRPDILKDIYFEHVFVATLYNPTQLFLDLKKHGLDFIKNERDGKYYLGKQVGTKTMRIENMNYFLYLITEHLQTEKAVIAAILQLVAVTETQLDAPMNMKIQSEIHHANTADNYNLDDI